MCLSGLLGINNIILDSFSALNTCLLNYLSASRKLISWLQPSLNIRHVQQLGNHCMGDGPRQGMEMELGSMW